MAVGHLDYNVLRRLLGHDQLFHRTVTEFLREWSRGNQAQAREVVLIAEQWDRRGHELRSPLAPNGVPHLSMARSQPEGRVVRRALGLEGESRPVLVLLDGRVLVDPSSAEVASANGMTTELTGRRGRSGPPCARGGGTTQRRERVGSSGATRSEHARGARGSGSGRPQRDGLEASELLAAER